MKLAPVLPTQFVSKVVGVTFCDGYPDNIYSLAEDVALSQASCQLVRDPHNKHDPNAICVSVNGLSIGHLPRLISISLAPKIDGGEVWLASVDSIVVSTDNFNKPGVKISVWKDENGNL